MQITDVIKKLKKHLTKEQKNELRDALVKAGYRIKLSLDFAMDKWQYRIHRVQWQGQIVIRDMPEEDYYLRMKQDNNYKYYLITGDYTADTFGLLPLDDENDLLDTKWYDYNGVVKPESAYNPNKKIDAKDDILDKGALEIDEDNRIVIFHGNQLKGKYRYEGKWKEGPVFHKISNEEQLMDMDNDDTIQYQHNIMLSLYSINNK